MSFKIEQYSVADFITFNRSKGINLNPKYQRRGGVWSDSMQVYLIDTILREMSIPKIYFRTKINTSTLTSVRDVVDGQQRLRAIFRFADDKLTLTKRAGEYGGKKFSTLTEEQKEIFLGYMITTEHILNSDDDFAVKVFSRLNQTGVKLNAAETRNAEFDGEFKWLIVRLAERLSSFFLKYEILSIKDQIRMMDDELTAELVMLVTDGIEAGTSESLKRVYRKYDKDFEFGSESVFTNIFGDIDENLSQNMTDSFSSRTHFIMLFAALYNAKSRIPYWTDSDLESIDFRYPSSEAEWDVVSARLAKLDRLISGDIDPRTPDEIMFVAESRAATINTKSRRKRFPVYAKVFTNYV